MNDEQAPIDPMSSGPTPKDLSLADVVLQSLEGIKNCVRRMEQAIRASDFELLRVYSQQLRGAEKRGGSAVLARHAAELEGHAVSRSFDECLSCIAELKSCCEHLAPPNEK